MPKQIDPNHAPTRDLLRVVGPVVVLTGLLFTGVGIGSFFSAFGTFEPPRYFWCAFVGIPLLGVGGFICRFAFLGAVSRYMANEVAPVGKDVVNYMADGTKGAVREVAAAIGEGLRGDVSGRGVRCRQCNADNEADANYCNQCGAVLNATQACASCGEQNDADARFCNHCGQAIA